MESTNGGEKKRIWPTDPPYFLAKELLMTERTYKKDLKIINQWFRDEMAGFTNANLELFFSLIEAMSQHHNVFLRDLEHRLLLWESRGSDEMHRIGDVLLKNMVVLPIYEEYIEIIYDLLQRLNDLFMNDDHFQQIYRDFEQQKICYLPLAYIAIRPLHRLLHYNLILERLLDNYTDNHFDRIDCQGTHVMLTRTIDVLKQKMAVVENFILLCELQRDLAGFDSPSLVQPNRTLIRQGCLLKHSKRGLQQRMFFLFSDVFLYASKSPANQTFKVLGHVPVRSLLTENAEHNAFVIFGGQRAITVSAGTTAEKILWLAELARASSDIKQRAHVQLAIGSLKNCSSSEEGLETCGLNAGNGNVTTKTPTSRSNTALYVCWHRGATVGLGDHLLAAENHLSGYLLRKFKNSSGWQKLWVVFTSFCLYFYKNYQDEYALASLPLLGYTVGPPTFQDTVQKEFVFKLSFKNHVYFFRAESEHTFNRWLEVLRSTTKTQDFKNMTTTG